MSGLKGVEKEETRRKERNMNKFRTGKEFLDSRIEKKLTENTQWYKRKREGERRIQKGIERERQSLEVGKNGGERNQSLRTSQGSQ